MGSGNWGGEQAGAMESRPMWHQLGPPVRRQSPVRALCSVILGFTLLAATLALVLSWLLATGILDPGAPARAQAARKLDISRLPTPTTRLPRPTTKHPSTTTAPTPSEPTTTVSEVSLSCEPPGFLCKDGVTCLGTSQICDGVMNCPRHELGEGGEDEDNCAAGSGQGELNISPILVALTSRPEVTVTTERFVAEEGVAILEEETQNVLSEVLRVVGETRRRLEETKDSTAASVEEVTTVDPSGVTKEVDNAVDSTTLEVEEDIALVTEESSSAAEVGTTKPIEVWTLRPNWSTGGSTLQNEETTNAVSLADDATVIEVTTTEKISTIGDKVTTEAAKTAQDTTPAFTISASTSEEATEPSIVTEEESITESERKDIITTTALPLAEDSSVTTDVTEAISVTTDSEVTTDSDVTTESSDEKELPEVKLERKENEVEIDAESETEKNESSAEEEFAVERPRSLS